MRPMRPLRILSELRVPLLTLLLLGTAELFLHPHVFKAKPSSLTALQSWSEEAASEPETDVLLIGSSRFRPLEAALISRAAATETNDRPPRVVNASFNGGTWDATARLLERYASDERVVRGPRLLLVGSGVMDANDGHENAVVASSLWTPTDLARHVWDHGTDAQTRAYLFGRPPAGQSALLTAYQQKLLRGELRDLAFRMMASPAAAPSASTSPNAAQPAAADPLDNAEAREASAGVHSLADIPAPVGGSYVRNFHLGGRQTEALRSLIRRMRAAGVVTVIIDAPLSDWYRSGMIQGEEGLYQAHLRTLGETLDVPVFLLPREAWGLTEGDYFVEAGRFDGHHIASAAGRVRFAEGLGREVVAPILARLAAGQPVGFAQGRWEPRP